LDCGSGRLPQSPQQPAAGGAVNKYALAKLKNLVLRRDDANGAKLQEAQRHRRVSAKKENQSNNKSMCRAPSKIRKI
jgi:hypothetical protein